MVEQAGAGKKRTLEADEKAERKAARKAERKAERKAARKAERKAEHTAEQTAPKESTQPVNTLLKAYTSFAETPFAPAVRSALATAYASPTPIQAQAWPAVVNGGDLIAVAKTGSGKTLAFALPVLHRLSSGVAKGVGSVRGLVLSPTRELAGQIHNETERFAKLVNLAVAVVYGGTPMREQKAALAARPPALLVATPGRLVDLLSQNALRLGACQSVVLDEADRLLDMGFEKQIKATFDALPGERQTLLFSATWPKAVRKLAASYLRDGEATRLFLGGGSDFSENSADGETCAGGAADAAAAEAAASELSANKAISQTFVQATDDEKDNKLWALLCDTVEVGSRVIVFANTKRRVDNLARVFGDFGSCAIHGDKAQKDREAALAGFIANKSPLLFATDVAARGLDIKLVSHVINYDMARDVESYVHRIGRTGRAGATGVSITFWNPDYDKECAPALIKIARRANQPVPEWLAKYEGAKANKLWAVKKAEEEVARLHSDSQAA